MGSGATKRFQVKDSKSMGRKLPTFTTPFVSRDQLFADFQVPRSQRMLLPFAKLAVLFWGERPMESLPLPSPFEQMRTRSTHHASREWASG